jgi:hypothetical protein
MEVIIDTNKLPGNVVDPLIDINTITGKAVGGRPADISTGKMKITIFDGTHKDLTTLRRKGYTIIAS